MKHLEALAAAIFGAAFLFHGLAVTVETVMRKVFNTSLQGIDELGGYILAVGAALSMAIALVSRAHIRIDLLHDLAAKPVRILLNILAALSLLACALALLRMASIAVQESSLFQSTAQTPWATPLWIPQTAWTAALSLFAIAALWQIAKIMLLVMRGAWHALDRNYGPRGARDELEDELEDLRKRSGNPS